MNAQAVSSTSEKKAHGLPHELIQVCAYRKWAMRCNAAGKEMHGYDKTDWTEAEKELYEIQSSMTPADMIEFLKWYASGTVVLDRQSIETRAYFKSQQHPTDTYSQELADQHWREAEAEERLLSLAESYLNFKKVRRNFSLFDPDNAPASALHLMLDSSVS